MAIDWYTFTASEWSGFTTSEWSTFVPFATYDPTTVWAAASAVFMRPHVIGHYAATAAQAVMEKRGTKAVFTAVAASAAWKADDRR